MSEFNYEETFELMKAYNELGDIEQKIIKYLMTIDVYNGSNSELSRNLNIDVSNLSKCLTYLDVIGIIIICADNKERRYKKTKSCSLADGWLDILLEQYRKNHIHSSIAKKKEVIEYYKKLEEEKQEKEKQIAEIKRMEQITEVMSNCFDKDISLVEVKKMLEKLDINIKE